ncbi:c-type cytochrome [Tautonia sociabilis]|uniref:Cytochrome C n=1 Tax=Tautonia sociabilis TaxID=2080755 RepID=A0A432ME96_9BACT|nr:c-type cytochrome [Tautonia sociabilis]RUL83564.1 cytochrome C [Tautonia sociabilis]
MRIILALALVAAAAWSLSAVAGRGFSAREEPTALEEFLARMARTLATPAGVRELANPVEPTALALAEARDHFADHCAACHANDGSGRTMINAGLYPPAPDLRGGRTQRLSDGELFYIIKNGIRLTGMPGWGGEDEENWKLVLFLRHLPRLSAEERRLMEEINGLKDEGGHDGH